MNEASNEQRSFIGKVIQHLKDFIKGIKRLLRIYGSTDKAVRAAVETPVEQLEFIAQRFEIALKEAAKNKKPATDEGGVKYSLSQKDVQAIQSIGSKKSINQFSSAEIGSTRAMAEILYRDIKEKSPFFRAWFGDWRQYDTTPIVIADKKGNIRGSIINNDTGWSIQVSRKVFNETESHKGRINASAMSYLDYVNDIVKKAVLLDTFAMDKNKSENSLFMHSFYTLADIGNGPELIKLYVEEMNDPNGEKNKKKGISASEYRKTAGCSNRFTD